MPTSPEATELLNTFGVKYHDYQAITIDESEAGAIREALGKSKVLFLRNRGVAIAASTIPEAWYLVKLVVTACQTQMRLLQLGGNAALLTELTEDSAALAASGGSVLISARPFDGAVEQEEEKNEIMSRHILFFRHSTEVVWGVGDMEFEAQMRMLDSAGFRTGYVYRNPNLLRRQPTSMPWSGNSGTVTDFFTTDFSCGEISGVDDVTAANTAGAVQKAKIADHVRVNKERGSQRNQFLSNTSAVVPSPTIQLPVSREPQSQSTPQFCSDNLPLDRLTLNGHGDDKDLTQPPQPDLSSTTSTPKKKGTVAAHTSIGCAEVLVCVHAPGVIVPALNTLPARTSNTLETVDGIVSDDEPPTLLDNFTVFFSARADTFLASAWLAACGLNPPSQNKHADVDNRVFSVPCPDALRVKDSSGRALCFFSRNQALLNASSSFWRSVAPLNLPLMAKIRTPNYYTFPVPLIPRL
ncbi:unnamed protein product [Schistocephalus solidus]|uniref:Class II aldolase/adducin N-terminal domain-containing protein n=1 Tax=Schistocephalus solidus TaxID=70667 RepID=A0A3P7C5H8_SCHSO|nr:unnamed protein product [Schistocephalus solidus]